MKPSKVHVSRSADIRLIIPCMIALVMLFGIACRPAGLRIDNPYASVNWEEDGRYKANLHTHTILSGGTANPEEVIDLYRQLGYGILALTDHDDDGPAETTWPWQSYGRDPEALGMVAIRGNEISDVHHIGSHFNDYGAPGAESEDTVLVEIGRRGGTALFHHPGRYEKGVDWYVDMYRRYDHLIGQEIYNRDDRYPGDRRLWDSVLVEILPDRPVWGFASDDMHNTETSMGISWIVVIAPELTAEAVRKAIEGGRFLYVYDPNGPVGAAAPTLKAIRVDELSRTIQVEVSDQDSILWISDGSVIHRGNELQYVRNRGVGKYVRAEIHGSDGIIVGTQPFSIRRSDSRR